MSAGRTERRILSIWWPMLAIERWQGIAGPAPDEPVALVAEGRHGLTIAAANRPAMAGGARVGARLTDARALNPALIAVPHDSAGDARLVRRLARWAERWSPLVEVDGADGLRLDVSGAAHLLGGEAALVEDVRRRFAALGLTARAAIAPTAGAAWAVARYSPSPASGEGLGRGDLVTRLPSPIRQSDLAAALAPLPVAALRLDPRSVHILERLGLRTIGDLAGVPRRSLARRFREADHPLDALDRALGRKAEPLTACAAEPPPRGELRLAEPVADPAVLASALARLAEPLARELARRQLGARAIRFTAWRVDGTIGEARARTALATRDAAHIVRLLAERAAAIDPGFGFDGFALAATESEPLAPGQQALIGDPPSALQLARLIDRLAARLGAGRVRRPKAQASHLPERANGWESAVSSLAAERDGRAALPLAITPRKPQRLLDRAEAIAVIYATPEGLPRRFVWRRAVHDILRVEGPERIAPEWWRQPSRARLRDYYRVEDQAGRRYWIYREGLAGDGRGGAPLWFLHGQFG